MPAMLLDLFLIAALAAHSQQAAPSPTARVPTQVSVRIVRGARVALGKSSSAPGHLVRRSVVTVEDGSKRPARLVEFE
jgi:hypothetical protein